MSNSAQAKSAAIIPFRDSADSMIDAWVKREVIPWQAKPLNAAALQAELIQRHESNPFQILLRICGGTVERVEKNLLSPEEVPDWRIELYETFLRQVIAKFCPELEIDLLLDIGDGGVRRESVPIFVFQKERNSNALMLPDVDFLSFGFYENRQDLTDKLAFAAKDCRAVFAGKLSGMRVTEQTVAELAIPRLRAAVYFQGCPWVDFRLPSLPSRLDGELVAKLTKLGVGNRADRLNYQQQFQSKFIMSMDGFGATCSRLPIVMRSNSVLMKYESVHQLFYFEGLVPWLHYVPVATDQEAAEIVRIEQAHPGTFEPIARNANAFAETFLNRDAAMRYTARLLQAYGDLTNPARAVPPMPRDGWPIRPGPPSLRVMAHISNHGDAWFSEGAWAEVAGPKRLIEGFVLNPETGLSQDSVIYQGIDHDGVLLAEVKGGDFAGSKGKSRALTGMAMRLDGQVTDNYSLTYSARFADGAEIGPCRQGEVCQSGSRAPMTAIRVEVTLRTAQLSNADNMPIDTPDTSALMPQD